MLQRRVVQRVQVEPRELHAHSHRRGAGDTGLLLILLHRRGPRRWNTKPDSQRLVLVSELCAATTAARALVVVVVEIPPSTAPPDATNATIRGGFIIARFATPAADTAAADRCAAATAAIATATATAIACRAATAVLDGLEARINVHHLVHVVKVFL